MESSRNIFAAVLAAGIMGMGTVAHAQPGVGCPGMGPMGMADGGGPRGMMRSAMREDPAAFISARTERRLALLKAELKPTAAQEPLWNAFAEKARSEAGQGVKAMQERSRQEGLSAPERMAQMNGVMRERLAAHEAVTESFKRLYDALTPEQKKAADQHVARMGRAGGMMGPKGPPAGG